MLQPKNMDRIFAGLAFLVGFVTYWSSVAPTTPFWDCGEFIACSYIMGVPHPPGSPLFLLWGRMMTFLPISADIGLRVNMISVIVSSFALMFMYLTIVRLIKIYKGEGKDLADSLLIRIGALIGTFALGFSYSFWFNSVESEVYAASTFFTAIVMWLILKWTDFADEPKGDRILLFIAYCIGLATGVHLLNLLALWTLFMVMYFHKFKFSLKGFLLQLSIATIAFLVVYPGIVKYIPTSMEMISVWFPRIVISGIILILWWAHKNRRRYLSLGIMAILLVILGYSTYSVIFIRSKLEPRIDENNPDNIDRLVYYLNREQYGEAPIFDRRWNNNPNYKSKFDFFWRYQVHHMYTRYFLWQFVGMESDTQNAGVNPAKFWGLPLLLGFIGLTLHFQKDSKRAFSILTLFFMTGYAVILYLNQEDPQPRERDYSYVGSFYAFAIWIGIGAAYLLELARQNSGRLKLPGKIGMGAAAVILLAAVPLNMLLKNYDMCKRSGNYIAWDYSYNMLQTCAPDGIIFTNGDNDTFPLWYLQEVEKVRTDVRVVNLSLLNTGWYIKQLRDAEPKVPITFNDDFIDRYIDMHDWEALRIRYWPDPREIEIASPDGIYHWELAPTMRIPGLPEDKGGNNFIRVQDYMILNIMHANQGKKPIYFAVTVSNQNMIGLRPYLTMEGLAFRVHPQTGQTIDPLLLRKNLFEKFANNYRNLDNPKIHYDDNIVRLLQNYRSAFLQLAYYYYTNDQPGLEPSPEMTIAQQYAQFDSLSSRAKVNLILQYMEQKIPEAVIPLNNDDISIQLGRMYYDIGKPEELTKRLDRLASTTTDWRKKAQYGLMYQQWLNEPKKAEKMFDSALQSARGDLKGSVDIITLMGRLGETDKAMGLLQKILKENPTDEVKKDVAAAYYQINKDSLAMTLYQDVISRNNADGEAVGGLLTVYERMGEFKPALELLNRWLEVHPADSQAQKKREQFQKMTRTG